MSDELFWRVLRTCMILVSIAVSIVIAVACFNAVMTMLGLR